MTTAIDLSSFMELFGDEPEFQEEIFTLFLEETPGKLEKMQQAAASGDRDTVSKIAHSLKSPLSTLGCAGMLEVAMKLEHNDDLDPGQIGQLLQQLDESLAQAYKEIRSALAQLS